MTLSKKTIGIPFLSLLCILLTSYTSTHQEMLLFVALSFLASALIVVANSSPNVLHFILYVSVIVAVAFPKAGLKVDQTPIIGCLIAFGAFMLFFLIHCYSESKSMEISAADPMRTFFSFYSAITYLYFPLIFLISVKEYGTMPSLFVLIPVFLPMFAFWMYYHYFSFRSDRLARGFMIALAFTVVYGIIQHFFGHYRVAIPGLTVNYTDYQAGRVFEEKNNLTDYGLKLVSTYQNGNLFGFLLIAGITITFALLFSRRRPFKSRKMLFAILMLAMACMVLTLSRSAIIGLCVALLVFSFYCPQVIKYFVLTMVALIGIAYNLGITDRIFSGDYTGAGRTFQYENFYLTMKGMDLSNLLDMLLIGKGMGYGYGIPTYEINYGSIQTVESGVINLVIYSGIIGLFIYILPLLYGAVKLISLHRSGLNPNLRSNYIVASGLVASLSGMLGQMSIDQLLNLAPTGFIYWMVSSWLYIELRRLHNDQHGDPSMRLGKDLTYESVSISKSFNR